MERARHNMISLGLAALYSALATAGDSLHGLLPCPDVACAVGQDACDCGQAHFDWAGAKSQATGSDGIEWQTSRHGHDASTCALCGVLGQLKVATSIAAPAAEISTPIADVSISTAPVRAQSVSRLHAARGPPAASV